MSKLEIENPNPSGLCFCGCGQKTTIATYTNKKRNVRKGCPTRYLNGHAPRSNAKLGYGRWQNGAGYINISVRIIPVEDRWLIDERIRKHQTKSFVLEHRYVMAKKINRPLLKNETVHHVNGIKTDNRPENLELWSSSQPYGIRVSDKCPHCNGTGFISK